MREEKLSRLVSCALRLWNRFHGRMTSALRCKPQIPVSLDMIDVPPCCVNNTSHPPVRKPTSTFIIYCITLIYSRVCEGLQVTATLIRISQLYALILFSILFSEILFIDSFPRKTALT